MRLTFKCSQCNEEFDQCESMRDGRKWVEGPELCYESTYHTIFPLPEGDNRRVDVEFVCLTQGQGEQSIASQMKALDGRRGIKKLFIQAQGPEEDFILAPDLPDLEYLEVHDMFLDTCMKLTTENVPKLKELSLKEVADTCTVELDLPNLERFSVGYWHCAEDVAEQLVECLSKASKLREYKVTEFWLPETSLYSEHLTECVFANDPHEPRSSWAQTRKITLFAPKLQDLRFVAFDQLETIEFLEENPLEPVGDGEKRGQIKLRDQSKFSLSLNTNKFSEETMKQIKGSVRFSGKVDDRGMMVNENGMSVEAESIIAQLQAQAMMGGQFGAAGTGGAGGLYMNDSHGTMGFF